eukprot:6193758-Pleurochrysis_carterae.AAC.4
MRSTAAHEVTAHVQACVWGSRRAGAARSACAHVHLPSLYVIDASWQLSSQLVGCPLSPQVGGGRLGVRHQRLARLTQVTRAQAVGGDGLERTSQLFVRSGRAQGFVRTHHLPQSAHGRVEIRVWKPKALALGSLDERGAVRVPFSHRQLQRGHACIWNTLLRAAWVGTVQE